MSQIIIDTNDDVRVLRHLSKGLASLVAELEAAELKRPLPEQVAEAVPVVEDTESFVPYTPKLVPRPVPEEVPEAPKPEPTVGIAPAVTPSLPPSTPPVAPQVEDCVEAVDPEGYTWDARIHSSSKERLAKTGCWKLRRRPQDKTPEEWERYVAAVKLEQEPHHAWVEGRAPVAAPVPTPEPEPTPQQPAWSLPELYALLAQNPSIDYMNICSELGLMNVAELANNDELIGAFVEKAGLTDEQKAGLLK